MDLGLLLARPGLAHACLLWNEVGSHAVVAAILATALDLRTGTAGVVEQVRAFESVQSGNQLSSRDRDVLALLATGARESEVAHRLGYCPEMIDGIVRALKDKLDAPSLFVLGMRAALLGVHPDRAEGDDNR